jgi:hypothetical protein
LTGRQPDIGNVWQTWYSATQFFIYNGLGYVAPNTSLPGTFDGNLVTFTPQPTATIIQTIEFQLADYPPIANNLFMAFGLGNTTNLTNVGCRLLYFDAPATPTYGLQYFAIVGVNPNGPLTPVAVPTVPTSIMPVLTPMVLTTTYSPDGTVTTTLDTGVAGGEIVATLPSGTPGNPVSPTDAMPYDNFAIASAIPSSTGFFLVTRIELNTV